MAWCHQATSHYLSQCWPRSLLPSGVTKPQCVNSIHGWHHRTTHFSTLGARASAAMILTWFSWNNPFLATKGWTIWVPDIKRYWLSIPRSGFPHSASFKIARLLSESAWDTTKFPGCEHSKYQNMSASTIPLQATYPPHLDGLMQERRNSTANALELHLSCTDPLIC